MKNFKHLLGIILVGSIFVSCSDSDDDNTNTASGASDKQDVINNFVDIVSTSYNASLQSAISMQTAIDAFVAQPSEQTHSDAKNAWLVARDYYGQTEVYRGGWGPIDSEGGETWAIANEGQMNAWPLDEGYIDYVKSSSAAYAGAYSGGIIAGTAEITKTLLESKNEGGDGLIEDDNAAGKAISTGWHAIEFLLWGQDETAPSANLAGLRSYTDYVIAEAPVAAKSNTSVVPSITNQERRGEYLTVVTELLIDDLTDIANTWDVGGTYRGVFNELSEDEALAKIATGPHFLASEELSGERILASANSIIGIDGSGQEDEHSCFADNTHRDVYTNAQGIINVLLGEYEDGFISQGASIYTLVKAADPAQAAKLLTSCIDVMSKVKVIDDLAKNGTYYDELCVIESVDNQGALFAADAALTNLGNIITESLNKLGVSFQ